MPYKDGDSVVLYNEGSNYRPRIKVLITKVIEPHTNIEQQNKIQLYINKKAVSMLAYKPVEGQKKLKIMKYFRIF